MSQSIQKLIVPYVQRRDGSLLLLRVQGQPRMYTNIYMAQVGLPFSIQFKKSPLILREELVWIDFRFPTYIDRWVRLRDIDLCCLEGAFMLKSEELSNSESCLNRAAFDDLVFVLIEHDVAAPAAIRAWIDERIRLGKNKASDGQIIAAFEIAQRMEARNKEFVCAPCHGLRKEA